MNRRALFGFLGVSPVAVAGAALAATKSDTRARDEPDPEAMMMTLGVEKNGNSVLTLGRKSAKGVDLNIGRDGALWIRSDGAVWRRVVAE